MPRHWPADSVRSEDDVLAVINRYREQGVTCRATRTRQRTVRPLDEDDALREAARRHSAYMAQRGAFDHTLAGCAFSTWIDAAGYMWRAAGFGHARAGTRQLWTVDFGDR